MHDENKNNIKKKIDIFYIYLIYTLYITLHEMRVRIILYRKHVPTMNSKLNDIPNQRMNYLTLM